MWDSHDSLGRVFPFAFFVVCPPEALGGNPPECWASCAAIHAQLADAHAHLGVPGTGGDFYRHYDERSVSLNSEDRARRAGGR